MKITSLVNPRVKHLVKLRNRRYRTETGLTVVEGVREVMLAGKAGVKFEEIYVCDELLDEKFWQGKVSSLLAKSKSQFETTAAVFQKISFGDRKEGLLAVCQVPHRHLSEISLTKNSLFVVIENVEKPGNLGAVLRSCDAAGVTGLIVSDETSDIYSPNAVRASLGTVFTVPVFRDTAENVYEFLHDHKIKILAASPGAQTVYTDADMRGSTAVVVGSEQKGLAGFWMQKAQTQVKIPMLGKGDSLNVSTATAVLLYEALRQRNESA